MKPGATVRPVQSIVRPDSPWHAADRRDPVAFDPDVGGKGVAAGAVHDSSAVQQTVLMVTGIRASSASSLGMDARPVDASDADMASAASPHFLRQRRRVVFAHLRNRAGDAEGGGYLAGLVENRRADATVADLVLFVIDAVSRLTRPLAAPLSVSAARRWSCRCGAAIPRSRTSWFNSSSGRCAIRALPKLVQCKSMRLPSQVASLIHTGWLDLFHQHRFITAPGPPGGPSGRCAP